MWIAEKPNTTEVVSQLKTAMTYKKGKLKYLLTDDDIQVVQEFYKDYDYFNGQWHPQLRCGHLKTGFLDAMKNTYKEVQNGGRLASLRGSLLLGAEFCPFCGVGDPKTLDHYLPISVFQIFSIYPNNLVPICNTCNNIKRASGENVDERFVHFYFDLLPDNFHFFDVTIKLIGSSLQFEFFIRNGKELDNDIYKKLVFQIDKLELNSRLRKYITKYLNALGPSIQTVYESSGKVGVEKLLTSTANNIKKHDGINHWTYAVIFGLSKHQQFCDGGFYDPLALDRLVQITQPDKLV